MDDLNVLEWKGPEFLAFYIVFLIGAIVLASVIAKLLGRVSSDPLEAPLFPPAVGYIRNGAAAAVDATIAMLVGRGLIAVRTNNIEILRHETGLSSLEMAVLGAVHSPRQIASDESVKLELDRLKAYLQDHQLIRSDERNLQTKFAVGVVMGLALVVGTMKLAIGLMRDRPVGFLTALLIIATIVSLGLVLHTWTGTSKGKAYLVWSSYQCPKTLVTHQPSPAEMAMHVALYGLAGTSIPLLMDFALIVHPPNTSGGSGGSSCGGSSCGGGGCGGGGCGGCGS